ncbi:phage tail tape measure protein [Escherichia coli]|uniref:phage tail tape measure protein n=5 Tax=Escherichia coli TaxID=562 RepID=UPI0010CBA298|nr:phage tail tape measure protein [Escherichia coli]EHQ5438944.1 phage tail tape measure protein [Escherichia coli O168]ELQ0165326.1 phage tail tape measure protein [Escherichia coli O153]EET6550339.1 phage tail tape measure protein [Escherichia coli]EEV9898822.1 phage tail tape measure protein [Escherichia coli]EFB3955474.1 phage tail tape measure protein [Escherichia coli]
MAGNFADLTAVLTLDSARFSEEAARVKKELGETSALADLMSGKVSQSFRKQADAAEQSLSRQALAAQKAGISVGQYKAAMRTLPAQFTDIVTQLAGGQNPFLIMLQQGGQISDSFGGPLSLLTLLKEELLGIRDASESSEESLSDTANALAENARNAGELGRFMSVARVAAGGGVAVLAALAAAAWQAEQADRALLRSLTLTGGAAATTTAELWKMAGLISDEAGGGIRQAAENLARLAESGKYTAGQLRIMGETSQRWLQTVGDDAGKVEKAFEGIAADPVKALASLNQQYNFLSVSQLRHIDELERTKGKQAAVTEAMSLFADVMNARLEQLDKAATPVEKIWDDVKTWTSDAWAWIGDHTLGALSLITDVVAGTVEQVKLLLVQGDLALAEFIQSAWETTKNVPGVGALFGELAEENRVFIEKTKRDELALRKSIAERDARIRQGEMGYINRSRATGVSKGPGQQEAVSRLAEELTGKKHTSPKTRSAGEREEEQAREALLALEAELRTLEKHSGANEKISRQRRDLWKAESQYAVLKEAATKRQLSGQEKSLLAHEKETLEYKRQLAELGDKVEYQKRLNELAQQAARFEEQQSAKQAAISAKARGLTDRQAQRESEEQRLRDVYGDNPQALAQVTGALKQTWADEDMLRGDWLAGLKSGWGEWAESATDSFSQVKSAATQTFDGIAQNMAAMLTGAEADWRGFTRSVLSMMTEILLKQAMVGIVGRIGSAIGGAIGGAGASASTGTAIEAVAANFHFATGGFTGTGGKYEPAGIVHRGEFVFTKEATSRIGVGNLYRLMRGYAEGGYVGGAESPAQMRRAEGINFNQNNHVVIQNDGINGQAGPQLMKAVYDMARKGAQDELRLQLRDGGMLSGSGR